MKLLLAAALAALVGCAPDPRGEVELTEEGIADAQAGKPVIGSTLDVTQTREVIGLLARQCDASWCADFKYTFERVACHLDTNSCTVTLAVDDRATAPRVDYWRSCNMYGVSAAKDIVVTLPNGSHELTQQFLDRVDECMTTIAGSI